jgi:outer membrane receptor for ferrienterochelin and colicins
MIKSRCLLAAVACATSILHNEAAAEAFERDTLEELAGEPITLSATGAPQRVTDAPVDMTIITQDEIRRSGAIDIPGVLERLASVDVMRTTRGQVDVSIRGYNSTQSPRLLVLLNGRQVYLDTYGMTNWNGIPVQLAEIRQIEVVNGPNTALFGFNAVAGVVNIVTYDALQDDVDAVSVIGGHRAYAGASAVWTGRLNERIGARLSLGGAQMDSTDLDDAAWRAFAGIDARDPKIRSAAANIGIELAEGVRADIEGTWASSASAARFFVSLFDQSTETASLKLALSADTDFGLITAQAYVNNADLGTNTPAGVTTLDNRTIVASLSLITKPAAAHTLRPSLEYRRNEVSQGYGEELQYDLFAASGMWNWQISDALALTSALRLDTLQLERTGPAVTPTFPFSNSDYDRTLTELSFNVGAVYRLTDIDALRFSVARGVGSPSLLEFGVQNAWDFGGVPLYFAGDPDIEATTVHNAELGWERDVAAFGGRLSAVVFWQRNEDLKILGAVGGVAPDDSLLILAGDFGESEMFGFELGANGVSGRLQWRAQYSWRDIQDQFEFTPFAFTADFQRGSPQHVATAGLLWTEDHWEYGADVRYTGETVQFGLAPITSAAPRAPVDAYVQTNLHVAWMPQSDVRLELSGRDVFEARTQTIGAIPVERGVFLSLTKGL